MRLSEKKPDADASSRRARTALAQWLIDTFGASVQKACRLADFSRAGWYKKSQAKDQTALRLRIRDIALARPRFGYNRIHTLLRREGWRVNKKRVRRRYRLEGLPVRLRVRRRKYLAVHRGPVPVATGVHQRWSMDVVHDQLMAGRAFRVLTVVDQWSRQSPILEVGFSLTGQHVVAAMEAVGTRTTWPRSITVDHGSEFVSRAVDAWAFVRGVALDFTRPGKPTDNGHIESFNGRLRDECLNVHQFLSLDHAKLVSEAWRRDYNEHRPHSSLGDLTPTEFAASHQDIRPAIACGFSRSTLSTNGTNVTLAASLESRLAQHIDGLRRWTELAALDCSEILLTRLPWAERAAFDRLAPTHREVPSGSRIAID